MKVNFLQLQTFWPIFFLPEWLRTYHRIGRNHDHRQAIPHLSGLSPSSVCRDSSRTFWWWMVISTFCIFHMPFLIQLHITLIRLISFENWSVPFCNKWEQCEDFAITLISPETDVGLFLQSTVSKPGAVTVYYIHVQIATNLVTFTGDLPDLPLSYTRPKTSPERQTVSVTNGLLRR